MSSPLSQLVTVSRGVLERCQRDRTLPFLQAAAKVFDEDAGGPYKHLHLIERLADHCEFMLAHMVNLKPATRDLGVDAVRGIKAAISPANIAEKAGNVAARIEKSLDTVEMIEKLLVDMRAVSKQHPEPDLFALRKKIQGARSACALIRAHPLIRGQVERRLDEVDFAIAFYHCYGAFLLTDSVNAAIGDILVAKAAYRAFEKGDDAAAYAAIRDALHDASGALIYANLVTYAFDKSVEKAVFPAMKGVAALLP